MMFKPLPRYLQVAHWLHEQRRPISSREVAEAFNVSPKAVSDDFSKIRRRSDIMDVHEQKIRCNGAQQYLLHVLNIHPYILDERQCPHRQGSPWNAPDTALTWRHLLSRPWHQVVQIYQNSDAD